MKTRKTYGINGLLEWHGIVNSGGINMKVDFVNGSVTAFGVSPATFTTEHALTQAIIENSEQFKKGKIRIVRVVQLEEEAPDPAPAQKKVEAKKEEPEPEVKAEEQPAEKTEEKAEVKKVEVSCADDAKDYLVTNFGVAARNLRSLKAINDTAAKYNIEFVGL